MGKSFVSDNYHYLCTDLIIVGFRKDGKSLECVAAPEDLGSDMMKKKYARKKLCLPLTYSLLFINLSARSFGDSLYVRFHIFSPNLFYTEENKQNSNISHFVIISFIWCIFFLSFYYFKYPQLVKFLIYLPSCYLSKYRYTLKWKRRIESTRCNSHRDCFTIFSLSSFPPAQRHRNQYSENRMSNLNV